MISGGIQNPWRCHWCDEIQKKDVFFSKKSCSRDFGAPACHPSSLIDFVNTALASIGSVETICMIWVGCRTPERCHWSEEFQKIRRFFFGNSCSRGFGAPGCNPSTLIDFANAALTSKDSVEPIYRISEG